MSDKLVNSHDAFFKHYFSQPSGLEMAMALLRYISRAAVELDKAEITQKLLTYLPKKRWCNCSINCSLRQRWLSLPICCGSIHRQRMRK